MYVYNSEHRPYTRRSMRFSVVCDIIAHIPISNPLFLTVRIVVLLLHIVAGHSATAHGQAEAKQSIHG